MTGDGRGKGRRFAIVASEFNAAVTDGLLTQCLKTLRENGVAAKDMLVAHVPGAFELPLAAQTLAGTRRFNAVIALGCVLRGETPHDRYLAAETARGLGDAALATGVPVIFGVLTPLDERQARERSSAGPLNKGREAALAALRMANLMPQLVRPRPAGKGR